jgi:hypothetical protein
MLKSFGWIGKKLIAWRHRTLAELYLHVLVQSRSHKIYRFEEFRLELNRKHPPQLIHIPLAQSMEEYWSNWNIQYPSYAITNMVRIYLTYVWGSSKRSRKRTQGCDPVWNSAKKYRGLPAEDVQEQRDGARSISNGKWMLSASDVIMAQSRTSHDARALRPCRLLPLLGSVAFKVLRLTKLRLPS